MEEVVKYLISQAGPLGVLCAVLMVGNVAQWMRGVSDRNKVEKAVEALALSTQAIKECNLGRSQQIDLMQDILRIHNETLAKIEWIRVYMTESGKWVGKQ